MSLDTWKAVRIRHVRRILCGGAWKLKLLEKYKAVKQLENHGRCLVTHINHGLSKEWVALAVRLGTGSRQSAKVSPAQLSGCGWKPVGPFPDELGEYRIVHSDSNLPGRVIWPDHLRTAGLPALTYEPTIRLRVCREERLIWHNSKNLGFGQSASP